MLALAAGKAQPILGAVLLVIYPVSDGLSDLVDAARSGGLRRSPTQTVNVIVSAVVALAVVITLRPDFHAALGVIGG